MINTTYSAHLIPPSLQTTSSFSPSSPADLNAYLQKIDYRLVDSVCLPMGKIAPLTSELAMQLLQRGYVLRFEPTTRCCFLSFGLFGGGKKEADDYLEQGKNYLRQGNLEGAFGFFTKAIESAPEESRDRYYFERGVAFEQCRKLDDAKRDYEEADKLGCSAARAALLRVQEADVAPQATFALPTDDKMHSLTMLTPITPVVWASQGSRAIGESIGAIKSGGSGGSGGSIEEEEDFIDWDDSFEAEVDYELATKLLLRTPSPSLLKRHKTDRDFPVPYLQPFFSLPPLTPGMLVRSLLPNPTIFEQLIQYGVISESGKLQNTWEKKLPPSLASLKDLLHRVETGDVKTLNTYVSRAKESRTFVYILRKIVHDSKHNPNLAIAAANAITILNMAGELFYSEDLSGIRIPGANLQGIVLDKVSLRGADLSGVCFSQAWLQEADLRECEMRDVSFGERPSIHFGAEVKACCLSTDGKWILAGGKKATLKLFEFASGREVRRIEGAQNPLVVSGRETVENEQDTVSIALSQDGKVVLAAYLDKTVSLWDVASGEKIWSFKHSDDIASVTMSQDGRYALLGSRDNTLIALDLVLRKAIRNFTGHEDEISSVALSQDGRYALSGSYDATLKLWEFTSGKEIRNFVGHSDVVTSVAFSQDGRYVLSGSRDHTSKLWNLVSESEIRSFVGHANWVHSVAFSPDGKYILSGGEDKMLKIWDSQSGNEIRSFVGHTQFITSVAFSPDGKYALSGSEDKTLKVWELQLERGMQHSAGLMSKVVSVTPSQDGRVLLGSADSAFKIWDLQSGRELESFVGHQGVTNVTLAPDGKSALSGSSDGTLKLWNLQQKQEVRSFTGHTNIVTSVAFSLDGRHILSGSYDKTLKLWDLNSGEEIRTFAGHRDCVTSVAFSQDRYVLSGSRDRKLKLWDLALGNEIRSFTGHTGWITSIACSQDGQYALSGSADQTLKLWNLWDESKKEISFEGHTGWVSSVAISQNGKYILSGSLDATLKLWNNLGQELFTLTGFTGGVTTCAIQGDFVIAGSADHSVKVWHLVKQDDSSTPSPQLLWSTHHPLYCKGMKLQGAKHLPLQSLPLLVEQGALLQSEEAAALTTKSPSFTLAADSLVGEISPTDHSQPSSMAIIDESMQVSSQKTSAVLALPQVRGRSAWPYSWDSVRLVSSVPTLQALPPQTAQAATAVTPLAHPVDVVSSLALLAVESDSRVVQ